MVRYITEDIEIFSDDSNEFYEKYFFSLMKA